MFNLYIQLTNLSPSLPILSNFLSPLLHFLSPPFLHHSFLIPNSSPSLPLPFFPPPLLSLLLLPLPPPPPPPSPSLSSYLLFFLQSIRSRAVLSSDGKHYILNGSKIW